MPIRAIDSSRTRQHGDGTAFVSREIHLRRRPAALPTEDDFQIVERSLPSPAAGKLIVRNLWMSVDPYMRGRMREGRSYIAPFDLDAPLDGAAVGVVEASGASDFSEGDVVTHFSGCEIMH